jgi:hypothetical protein
MAGALTGQRRGAEHEQGNAQGGRLRRREGGPRRGGRWDGIE